MVIAKLGETATTSSSTKHKHTITGTMEDIKKDGVLDSRCVAVYNSKETNFVSEKTETEKTGEFRKSYINETTLVPLCCKVVRDSVSNQSS